MMYKIERSLYRIGTNMVGVIFLTLVVFPVTVVLELLSVVYGFFASIGTAITQDWYRWVLVPFVKELLWDMKHLFNFKDRIKYCQYMSEGRNKHE